MARPLKPCLAGKCVTAMVVLPPATLRPRCRSPRCSYGRTCPTGHVRAFVFPPYLIKSPPYFCPHRDLFTSACLLNGRTDSLLRRRLHTSGPIKPSGRPEASCSMAPGRPMVSHRYAAEGKMAVGASPLVMAGAGFVVRCPSALHHSGAAQAGAPCVIQAATRVDLP